MNILFRGDGMDQALLFWTKIGALGQLAGALATFLAVIVSLYVVITDRREGVKLVVGKRKIIGGGVNLDVISFEITNVGARPFVINSIGWRTGWFKRGPQSLKYKWAIQLGDNSMFSTQLPHLLQQGQSASVTIPTNMFFKNNSKEKSLFRSRKFLKYINVGTNMHGVVNTALGTAKTVRVERDLSQMIEDHYY